MWYALLDFRSDTNSGTILLCGTLESIAREVIRQCDWFDPEDRGKLDFDALDEEEWYYEADDYIALVEAEKITPELLKDFSFTLSDVMLDISCLSEGYNAFREAFQHYDGPNHELRESGIVLPETVPSDEEKQFADELADILLQGEYFDELSEDRKYVTMEE